MRVRRLIVMGVMVLTAVPAMALSPLGPPVSRLDAGQWQLGGWLSRSEQDIKLEFPTVEIEGNVFPKTSANLDGVELNTVWGQVAVGLASQRAEIFGRVGAVSIEQDWYESTDGALGVGGRVTMQAGKQVSWGIVGLVSVYTGDDNTALEIDIDEEPETIPVKAKIDATEIQVAMGPCWHPGNFMIYGGPCVTYFTGDVVFKSSGRRLSADIDAEADFGGYIGARLFFLQGGSVGAEYQRTTDAEFFGGHVIWTF
ncbi:hypothetical protein [Anaerobaca lacustris]|uniref:Uncharacterized protein n=1 Tax=Anaerobaca lacustris TaxID=3044600 RepID=A0AAW6U354_9BACT|nr:hypothetical protein [Sedimentisphaerales bacterium M17dextr]